MNDMVLESFCLLKLLQGRLPSDLQPSNRTSDSIYASGDFNPTLPMIHRLLSCPDVTLAKVKGTNIVDAMRNPQFCLALDLCATSPIPSCEATNSSFLLALSDNASSEHDSILGSKGLKL